MKEPGKNIEMFGDKVLELARWIDSTGKGLEDLNVLVAARFLMAKSLPFKMEASLMHSLADKGEQSASNWRDIVAAMKSKNRSLKTQGLWDAEKEAKESEIQALKGEIRKP